jgi:hypothetical protein
MEQRKYEAKTHTLYDNSLNDSRFHVLLFILRLAGIPLNKKSVSRVSAVYNATVIVCFYITDFCACVDTFVHRHQLVYTMNKFRVILGMQVAMWTHFSIRQVALQSSFTLC